MVDDSILRFVEEDGDISSVIYEGNEYDSLEQLPFEQELIEWLKQCPDVYDKIQGADEAPTQINLG